MAATLIFYCEGCGKRLTTVSLDPNEKTADTLRRQNWDLQSVEDVTMYFCYGCIAESNRLAEEGSRCGSLR